MNLNKSGDLIKIWRHVKKYLKQNIFFPFLSTMLGSYENLGLQASFRGQDYKHQAVSGLQHNKTLLMCSVHSLQFNSSASRESRARDAIYTSHLCSIKVQGEEAVKEKRREREMVRLDNQTKKQLLAKY